MTQALSGTSHEAMTELLPWYVNGTLGQDERRAVEEHIGTCRDCRDDVDMLSRVSDAMRADSPAPLLPSPRSESLLAALDAGHGRYGYGRKRWHYAIAASVVAALAAAWLLVLPQAATDDAATMFETATSDGAQETLAYVIELQFEDGIDIETQEATFGAIGSTGSAVPQGDGTYRVTLSAGQGTLAKLEEQIAHIESLPGVASAKVVAVQLPVE